MMPSKWIRDLITPHHITSHNTNSECVKSAIANTCRCMTGWTGLDWAGLGCLYGLSCIPYLDCNTLTAIATHGRISRCCTDGQLLMITHLIFPKGFHGICLPRFRQFSLHAFHSDGWMDVWKMCVRPTSSSGGGIYWRYVYVLSLDALYHLTVLRIQYVFISQAFINNRVWQAIGRFEVCSSLNFNILSIIFSVSWVF